MADALGEVVVRDPPARLRYRSPLSFEPAEATEVDVTFSAVGGRTAVRLEQHGFDVDVDGPHRTAPRPVGGPARRRSTPVPTPPGRSPVAGRFAGISTRRTKTDRSRETGV